MTQNVKNCIDIKLKFEVKRLNSETKNQNYDI